jgi:hypothetical protein
MQYALALHKKSNTRDGSRGIVVNQPTTDNYLIVRGCRRRKSVEDHDPTSWGPKPSE